MDPGSPDARPGLFRPDEPVSSVGQDRFGHTHFVEALKYVICNGEAPLNIALYGKWGVGKSSILEFFRTEILKDESLNEKFAFATIDVWKLSPRILKQEFLDTLNSELKYPLGREEIEDMLWRHRAESSNQNTKSRYGWAIGSTVAIVAGLVVADQYFSSYFESYSWWPSSFVASLIPMFLVMAKELGSLAKSVTKSRTTIIPRIESHAHFQKLFKNIVDKIEGGKKPIIAIDNLDRCDDESVVAILNMIKTFLGDPGCVFIVSCDRDAIIKHLHGRKQLYEKRDANEFLSKFFQVSLYIPNQIKGQLYEYAKSQLEIFPDIGADPNVADVFANAGTKNPRKIRQFVYHFATSYKIASAKESEGVIASGTVTGNTPFLAKITVLREDWPDFFQKLEKKPSLLDEIQKFIEGNSEHPEYADILKGNEGLKYFLKSTGTTKSIQVLPFIQLNQESFEGSLPGLDRLIVGVSRNNVQFIKQTVQKEPEKQHEYVLELCRLAEEYVRDERTMVASNALNVLLNIHDIVEQKSQEKIRKTFDEFMTGDVLDNLMMFDIDILFPIASLLNSDTREKIHLKYAHNLSDSSYALPIIRKVARAAPLISSTVGESVDRNLKLLGQIAQEPFYDAVELLAQSRSPAIFIKENILGVIIDAVEPGMGDKWTEMYLKLKHLASEGNKKAFAEKMLSAITTDDGDAMQTIHRKIYETLKETTSRDFTADAAKYAYDALKVHAMHYRDVGERTLVAGIVLRAYPKLDPADREEFATEVFDPLIKQSGPQNLAPLAEAVRKEGVRILEFGPAADAVFSLLRNAPSRESVDLMYAGVPEGKWTDMEEKIVRVHGTDFAKAKVFASAFELSVRAPEDLRAKVLGRLAQSCQSFSFVQQLSIYQTLSEALRSESGLMVAFANGLSFELGLHDRAEIDAYLELAKKCFGKTEETKQRKIFSTLFDKLQQYPVPKIDSSVLKFLMSNNKSMDRREKTRLGKVAIKILGANNNSLIAEILDEFGNLDLGDNQETAYELVRKLCESHDQDIRGKALEIVEGDGLH